MQFVSHTNACALEERIWKHLNTMKIKNKTSQQYRLLPMDETAWVCFIPVTTNYDKKEELDWLYRYDIAGIQVTS